MKQERDQKWMEERVVQLERMVEAGKRRSAEADEKVRRLEEMMKRIKGVVDVEEKRDC